jgi:glycerophosphoryl diester phosphodiesterase
VRVDDDVIVIAHRGAAGRAPENTLAAFRAAIEDGADIVELDVQETSDGEVVVLHDSDFMKLAGDPRKLWNLSLAEARAIDIGSWFDPRYSEERIPTLSEVLELCRGQARVDIELKYYGHDQSLEERVVRIVEEADMASDVVVMSLNLAAMRKMRELRPTWTLGVLAATAVGDLTSVDLDFLAVHSGMATHGFTRRAHRAGKDVYAWTVNDPVHMSRLATRGVDGLITDEPALARSVLESRAEMSSVERLLLEAAFWLGAVPNEPPAEADLGG